MSNKLDSLERLGYFAVKSKGNLERTVNQNSMSLVSYVLILCTFGYTLSAAQGFSQSGRRS